MQNIDKFKAQAQEELRVKTVEYKDCQVQLVKDMKELRTKYDHSIGFKSM